MRRQRCLPIMALPARLWSEFFLPPQLNNWTNSSPMTQGVKAEEGHPRPTRIYTRYSSTSPTLAWLQLVAHPVGTRTALPASHLYSGLGASLAGSQSRHPRGGTRQAALSARTTVPVV